MPQYKHGKIEKTIDLDTLKKIMDRVSLVDRGGYSVEFVQSLIAILYWTGFRISEVIGAIKHKYKTKKGEVKYTPPFPGLLKENIWVDKDFLYVYQIARKHGNREEPVTIPRILPYVDLIIKRWEHVKPKAKVFPISSVTWWRIVKRIDPKLYSHFFILNRVTKLCENPENSMAQICAWTGKSPQTIAKYLGLVGRFAKPVGKRLLSET